MDWTDSGFGVMLKLGVYMVVLGTCRRGRGNGPEVTTEEVAGDAAWKRRLLEDK
jgi:hypothetical protein